MPCSLNRFLPAAMIIALSSAAPSVVAHASGTAQAATTPAPRAEAPSKQAPSGALAASEGKDPGHFADANWEALGKDDGVSVYKWEVPGSDIFAFKATMIMDAPFAKVASVLFDDTRATNWTPDLEEIKVIRKVSDTARIQYAHIGTPFVIKDRDFVLHASAEWNDAEQALWVRFRSVEDPDMPKTGYVRGDMKESYYLMKPLDGGARVQITYLVHVDPKGTVPRWLVNAFSKNFPRKTLLGLMKESKKADVKIHPGLIPVLQKAGLTATL